jgi:pimeloyl-ACP methyl ester carboxylesterase
MAALVAAGCSAEATSGPTSSAPTPSAAGPGEFSGLVELPSGRKVYTECRGEGSPTVVFESGGGDAADAWSTLPPGSTLAPVLPAVAGFTRVCAYDRPNTTRVTGEPSRSDPVPLPRTLTEMAAELHDVLAAAQVPGPYVVVGHSLGGAIGRLHAGSHPDDVVGFVSVDAGHELIYEAFERLVGPPSYQLPGVEYDLPATVVEMRQVYPSHPLQQMPMVVLEHSRDRQRFPNPIGWKPEWPLAELQQVWQTAQEDLSALVPGTVHVVASDSGHYIMIDQPQLVINAIHDVVDAARRGETRLGPAD